MTLYGLILGLVITLAALVAVVAIVQAIRDVEIEKSKWLDPRNDTAAAGAAAAKVRRIGPAGDN